MKVSTIVIKRIGLFHSDISRHSVDLHPNQRVNDGGFLLVHFGKLLSRYNLVTGGDASRQITQILLDVKSLLNGVKSLTMMWSVLCFSQSPLVRVMGSNSVALSLM